jgi:hypothetical protein
MSKWKLTIAPRDETAQAKEYAIGLNRADQGIDADTSSFYLTQDLAVEDLETRLRQRVSDGVDEIVYEGTPYATIHAAIAAVNNARSNWA